MFFFDIQAKVDAAVAPYVLTLFCAAFAFGVVGVVIAAGQLWREWKGDR